MKEDLDIGFWSTIGMGYLMACVGAYALICYLSGQNVWYIRVQLVVWALTEVMNRTRWRNPNRKYWEGFMTGLGWPAILLGAYWFIKKEEHHRKVRIIREVMEG